MTAAIIRVSPLGLKAGPWEVIPGSIQINGVRVDGAQIGWTDGTFLMVSIVLAGDQPTEYHTLNNQSYQLEGNVLTATRTWSPPTLAFVKTELKRRLNDRATQEWIGCRGTKASDIETANTNGAAAITAAGGIAAAFSAYQAVTWP